jgi:predicted Zn-dependent protease with MMP-like domain
MTRHHGLDGLEQMQEKRRTNRPSIGLTGKQLGSKTYTQGHANQLPPNAETIRALAVAAQAQLPEALRAETAHVTITVIEFPGEDLADDLGLETPFDLLGLFEGHGSAKYWTPRAASKQPDRLTLFRRAILDYWAENNEPLGEIVTHIVINELGHHYGLNEESLHDIENKLN